MWLPACRVGLVLVAHPVRSPGFLIHVENRSSLVFVIKRRNGRVAEGGSLLSCHTINCIFGLEPFPSVFINVK